MQAFAAGKQIECRIKEDTFDRRWRITITPVWNFLDYEYRVKPNDRPAIFAIRLPSGATITPYFEEADALAHAKSAPGSTVLKYNLDETYNQ